MTLLEAKDAARQESRAQKGKTYFVVVDAEGEADLSSKAKKDATVAAYKNGSEIALLPEHYMKVTEAPQPNATKGAAPNRRTAKTDADESVATSTTMAKKAKIKSNKSKAPKEAKLTRGNNMSLTKEQWAKVDAKLKKEDVSFSAFSRNLVLKSIGE